MRVHRQRIDDYAWIHAALRIEDALELSKRAHQLGAKHFGEQLRARDAVAMFAGDRSTVLADQVADLQHHAAKRSNPLRAGEIEVDPAVNAALPEVAVIHGNREIAPPQQLLEAAQILPQFFGSDGAILGSRPHSRKPRARSACAQAGFAQSPHRRALLRIGKQVAAHHTRRLRCAALQGLATLARLVHTGPAQLRDQVSSARWKQPQRGQPLLLAKLHQVVIEGLQRLGMVLQQPRDMIGGCKDIGEAEHHQHQLLGARHQLHGRPQHQRQRALRPNQRPRQIEAILRQQLIEVVP